MNRPANDQFVISSKAFKRSNHFVHLVRGCAEIIGWLSIFAIALALYSAPAAAQGVTHNDIRKHFANVQNWDKYHNVGTTNDNEAMFLRSVFVAEWEDSHRGGIVRLPESPTQIVDTAYSFWCDESQLKIEYVRTYDRAGTITDHYNTGDWVVEAAYAGTNAANWLARICNDPS